MIRREDFIRAMGAPDEGLERAVDAALRQVKESEARPVMKKKMTFTMLAAAIAILVLTGAALAVGLNLFDYFGERDRRLQAIAPETVLENAGTAELTTDALGVTKARIDSAYYDGQSLIVAYTLDNCQRHEPFEPTKTELAEMSENRDYLLQTGEVSEEQLESVEAFQSAIDHNEAYGLREYAIGIDDHCLTSDGVELPLSSVTMEDGEGGLLYCIQEFETPLPEAAQDRDSLELILPVSLCTSWSWFDGEKYYDRSVQEPLAELTVTVDRTAAVTRSYGWSGELNGAKASITAQVSAVHARLTIEMPNGTLPNPVALWPDAADAGDTWYRFVLLDPKNLEYRFSSSMEGEGRIELEYDGLGYLPDALSLTVCLDGEGDWNAEAHTLPGCPVTLLPD